MNLEKSAHGQRVASVFEGSAADRAGAKVGELIVGVNGESVVDKPVGELVKRFGSSRTVELFLADTSMLAKSNVPAFAAELPEPTSESMIAVPATVVREVQESVTLDPAISRVAGTSVAATLAPSSPRSAGSG